MIFKTDETNTILQKCIMNEDEKMSPQGLNVIIPEGITEIKSYAFWGQSNIVSVSLPSTLKYINQGAFEKCSKLKTVIIPDGVEVISKSAFRDCYHLEEFNLPKSLVLLGEYAFAQCRLHKIDIPASVKMIEPSAFHDTQTKFQLEDNRNVIICLDGYWNAPINWNGPQNHYLCNFISNPSVDNFKALDRISYKIPLALAYYDTDIYYLKYLKKYKKQTLSHCIETDDINSLIKVLDLQIIEREHIDTAIELAIEKERKEMIVLLMQYKNSIRGYDKAPDFEL